MDRLTGKKALVFGADAITLGIATRFLQEGASVVAIDIADALGEFGDSGAQTVAIADRGPEAIAKGVREAVGENALDILVIGGGDIPHASEWIGIDAMDVAPYADGVEKETAAAFAAVKAAGPRLKENGGSVIFLFNPAGLYSEGGFGEAPAAHHAKRGLARTLAMEWGQFQIRVNTLVPLANTPGYRAYRARNPEVIDWRVSTTAMKRVGDPVKDVGGAAVFLAADDTRYLTGSMIFADGGAFLGIPVVETIVPPA